MRRQQPLRTPVARIGKSRISGVFTLVELLVVIAIIRTGLPIRRRLTRGFFSFFGVM